MTTLDLAAIEADLQRQLDRTRRMPTEPMISIRAETLRGLIAAARAGGKHPAEKWDVRKAPCPTCGFHILTIESHPFEYGD